MDQPAPSPPAPTFSDLVRARLLVHARLSGHSLASLASKMGHGRAWLVRKLCVTTEQEHRGLSVAAVDQVLAALRLPPEALFAPAFGPGDEALLGWLAKAPDGDRTRRAARRVFADANHAVERLAFQGFLTEDEGGILHLTEAGKQHAA